MTEPRSTRRAYEFVRASVSIPENKKSPWHGIVYRVLGAVGLLVLNALIVYVDRDGYRDSNGDGLSWIDCLYYSGVTLSTTGYGDISPVTEQARFINFILLTPLRFAFIALFVGTTIEVLTKRSRQAFREARWRKTVNEQFIIVGYGVKGRSAVNTLLASGVPASAIVVVEESHNFDQDLAASQVVVVHGDARREETMRAAEISRASQVIISVDSDDTAVLITLVARRLNPASNIVVAVREGVHNKTFRQSGANTVINTDESTGHILADTALSPLAGAIISDLLDPTEGLEVHQRKVEAKDVGRKPGDLIETGELVVSVIREKQEHRFLYTDIGELKLGDDIVVVRPVD
jgi:voltage-gated potassium channel